MQEKLAKNKKAPARHKAEDDYLLTTKERLEQLEASKKEKYSEVQAAASVAGESVNGYIKRAIDERMERDNHPQGDISGAIPAASNSHE